MKVSWRLNDKSTVQESELDVRWLPGVQMFSVKMQEGIIATSYKPGDKFYIDPAKLLPLTRFLPQPK